MGDGMIRDRILELCLIPKRASKEERSLLRSFPGHRFDWRWEMAETVSTALDDRWDTLETYYDHDIVTSNGKLNSEGLDTLKKASTTIQVKMESKVSTA